MNNSILSKIRKVSLSSDGEKSYPLSESNGEIEELTNSFIFTNSKGKDTAQRYQGIHLIGNISDHKNYIEKELQGKIVYDVPVKINENVTIITSGYHFDEKNYDKISDYVHKKNDKLVIVEYNDGTYGLFGNTLFHKKALEAMGGKYKKYLLVTGPIELYTTVAFFGRDYNKDVMKYFNQVNGDLSSYLGGKAIDEAFETGFIKTLSQSHELSSKKGEREEPKRKKLLPLILVDYSDKAIAVFGDTEPYKDELMELKGRFNRYLKFEEENGAEVKKPGWIFSKRNYSEVEKFVNDVNDGENKKK